ncbi:hypothetical protein ABMA28_017215 [Loxostege sticticalis]|uniref:C2H2-type domain-containing protein n=1 Tax=Loxostege sticticalis TaxID=481309 RepID=A0ABD0S231_LOXSC
MEFNSDQEAIRLIREQDVCLCCLTSDVKFVSLSTCKHTSFFEYFFKFKFQYENAVICYVCHHHVTKFELFKEQVEESLGILWNAQTQPALLTKKFLNLDRSKTKQTTYTNNIDVKIETLVEHTEINLSDSNTEQAGYEILTEVKVENESLDLETDLPLSQIRKEIKKVKKKKKKPSKKVSTQKSTNIECKTKLSEKYEGKIAIVTLSTEEMMLERERDAMKESYLKLPYKCENCITGFDHELTLKEHVEKRHGEKKGSFVCEICKSVLSTVTSYREHSKRHFRRYECQECGKRNNNVYSVVKHYNEQHGTIETNYTCQECGFTTDSHRGYRYHRDKHKQKAACAICGSTFVGRAGLKVHMYTVHKHSSRVYSCATCPKVYNTKSGLAAHTATHSTTNAAFCVQCGTHFRTEQGLAHHLKTHSAHICDDDKRFTCDECGSKFLTKTALQEHIDFVHLKNIKHECAKCPKVFKNGSALRRHENFVHKKLRPPRNKICDHCGRGFTTLSILQSHIRTHTGERPLQCPNCPASFAHSAALYTHNKLLHNSARNQN